jgi:hypothetical protein
MIRCEKSFLRDIKDIIFFFKEKIRTTRRTICCYDIAVLFGTGNMEHFSEDIK